MRVCEFDFNNIVVCGVWCARARACVRRAASGVRGCDVQIHDKRLHDLKLLVSTVFDEK